MICRLCSSNSEVFYNFFNEDGQKLNIVEIVAKHFWFEPKPGDKTSPIICVSCWNTTKAFHELYLLVEKTEKDWASNLLDIKEDIWNELSNDQETAKGINTNDDEKAEKINVKDQEDNFSTKSYLEDDPTGVETDYQMVALPTEEKHSPCKEEAEDFSNLMIDDKVNVFTLSEEKADTGEVVVEAKPKRRGRPRKQINSLQINLNRLIKKKDSMQKKSEILGKHKNKIKKEKKVYQKRTVEEAAAFKKKIEERDEMIAKVLKIVCNICSEEQKNFTALKFHCQSIHKETGFVTCCQRKFYRKSKLVEHIERHVIPDKYKCDLCDHIAASARNLHLHKLNIHKTGEILKRYKCPNCSKAFATTTLLNRHELTHIPKEERKFKCSICDKNYPAESSLKTHIRFCHEGYYNAICDVCGKAYATVYDMKRHRLIVHINGGKKETFKCEYCEKEFKSKYSCASHVSQIHEKKNDTVYKCTFCDKVSPSEKAVRHHEKFKHLAESKYPCTLCEKSFKRELDLKEHIAFHTGQPLYSCPHCPRTFTHHSNMHHHRKLKHPIEFEMMRKKKNAKNESWIKYTSLNKI